MEKQSSWMERRVEGIDSRLGYQKAGTPLPPIRSQSSLGTTKSHGNPWAMTDPALKQMNVSIWNIDCLNEKYMMRGYLSIFRTDVRTIHNFHTLNSQ